ncbi:probable calcium-binding CML36 [Olea europaea subsp. europaea]|uniref:Probable calcium-binding CML36 n=1 Tax=Olea europaea subsp. europaea TaxID=158383 RepID=A0A8S0S2D8_OLEEU|nr:probable calcium-binding CML36 [Olea europaea subsp. europaea]
MKFIKDNPKKLFKRKKSRSVPRSESDLVSFISSDDSQTGFSSPTNGSATPTSVLPADELSDFELKQAFELIDRDGDGKIKKKELEALLIRVGAEPPSQEELRLMLNEVDVDGNGSVSLEEFYAIARLLGLRRVTPK